MAWIWIFLSAILLLSIFRRKKRLPPGPRSLPILGHFHLLGKHPHQDLAHLARKHGPIMGMQLGFKHIVVASSPAAAELFLKTHDLVFASRPRSEAAQFIGYEQRNLVWLPYGPSWRNIRKLSTLELLSNFKINQFRAMRRAEIGLLVDSLKRSSEAVDLSAKVFSLIGDMNCLMVLGRKYPDSDFDSKGFKAVFTQLSEIVAKFNVGDYFPYVGALDLHGINGRMRELSTIFDGFFEKIIDDHAREKKEKEKEKRAEDIVDTVMGIMESGEAGFEFDRRHVKGLLLDLLNAGSDTTAASVDWTLCELIRNPTIMKKLQKELELVVGMDHEVDETHLDKLEYLNCVVKESFRLHPVVPLLVPHESIEDCVVDGFDIPKNSRIMVNYWAIGRDSDVWHDPESFTPERFIGSNIDVKGHDFELIPFGSGRRGCPGMQLALRMVKLVVSKLVHCFDWELPNGMEPKDMDMSEHFGIVTARSKHLKVIPKYRLLN